ncbi:sigma 54-interacting transcriptional regulator [Psychrobacter sp. 1Y11]|uniref:sigma 54-interacting transcriptional regulator n=1 Tax=Psychrobacter sp. 1Y11 TaxID=3457446 RepID=UPI003FD62685
MSTANNDELHNTMTTLATLWLIDDDAALRLVLADTFTEANLTVISFTQAQAAWTRLNEVLQKRASISELPDVILTDIRMPMMDGLSFSDWVHKHFPELPIVIMTAHSDLTSAINSYQAGAFDYLAKPFDLDDAVAIIYKALSYQPSGDIHQESLIENNTAIDEAPIESNPTQNTNKQQETKTTSKAKSKLTSKPSVTTNPSGIIGQSQAMQTVFRAIGRLAHSPITVLITGESGTGKELVASALHQHSPRAKHPFIALNMAAIPHDLIESELFGHEKGAFTGATTQRQGRFEQADGGTLFLDEIGDMPFSTQTRLLRVLANGEFYRVGGQQPVKVDVRIIAATHQNLEQLVQQGKFREDLFYRLNVIRLPLPPLRARREDIPALASHFMQQAGEQMNTTVKQLSPDALRIMQDFDWRGNVRQLENVCLWLTVMAAGDTVLTHDLPPELLAQRAPDSAFSDSFQATLAPQPSQSAQTLDNTSPIHSHTHTAVTETPISWQQALADWAKQSLQAGETDILQAATPEFERVLLRAALSHSGGRKVAAAQLLGWGRNTLTRKLTLLDVSEPNPATED